MDNIIEMHGVSKIYKDKKAVDNISFNIAKGSITAILGPNGAGKTTALGMLLGLIEPTEGTVELFGQHPKDKEVREKTGAMLQEVSVMDRLKVREIIDLIRSYYPKPMDMDFLIKATGLAPADLNRYAEKLSGGQKRSLGFALALAGNPELIFLMNLQWDLILLPGGGSGKRFVDLRSKEKRLCSRPIICRKQKISRIVFCYSVKAT